MLDASLEELERKVARDLHYIESPASWTKEEDGVLDVAIIGAGMAGLATSFALEQVGIDNTHMFDQRSPMLEGPWRSEAKMKKLRSEKYATGPSLQIPCLTFQAYYEAKYGKAAWNLMDRATPEEWMSYLDWYRKVLSLKVKNNHTLIKIEVVNENLFHLYFDTTSGSVEILAKKVVFATGRAGIGGAKIPHFLMSIPKEYWAHTTENIDYLNLEGKRVAVLGCGAAAFDAAATAIEAKAHLVDLIFRRETIPKVNKLSELITPGFELGFHKLNNETRFKLISTDLDAGTPPPEEALERVDGYQNFTMRSGVYVTGLQLEGNAVILKTTAGNFSFDYIIAATGYLIDPSCQKELEPFVSDLLLWEGVLHDYTSPYGKFPYLGDHYQFMEKRNTFAPYLKNLFCFNFGALMSHGMTSSSIDGISTGAKRLAEGIAADFLADNIQNNKDEGN